MSTPTLSEKHAEQLELESGIRKETALRAGVVSLSEAEAIASIGIGGSGIGFPYYDTCGEFLAHRIKQDNPLVNENGKSAKYLTGKDSNASIYFPIETLPTIMDANVLILIEGEKKLLKFLQEQVEGTYPSIAMSGCWGFIKNGELHQVLEEILKSKTHVLIIPDSDYFHNHKVKSAYNRLAKMLARRGIKVSIIDIQIRGCDKKIGVDDFLMFLPFEKLQERMNAPFVTLHNLSNEEIIETIKKDGVSEKTLEKILNSLAFLDSFEIVEKLEAIKSISKLKYKDLFARFLKSMSIFSDLHDETSPDEHVKWNSKTEGQTVLFKRIGKLLTSKGNTYLTEEKHRLVTVSPDFSNTKIANTKDELHDLAGSSIVVEHVRQTERGEITIGTEPLPRNLVSIFFSYLSSYVMCPLVATISSTPFFSMITEKMIYKSGYYQKEKLILTRDFFPALSNHNKLKLFLDNIPFRSIVDYQNFLGMLISAVTFKNSLPGESPAMLIRAQEHGSGKSQLASSLQYLVEDKNFGMLTHKNDVELEKQFATQFTNSCPIIDNVRQGSFNSTFLEKVITDRVLSYRLLGSQDEISKMNNTLVIFTMNGGSTTSDLASRCIVIELDKERQSKSLGFNPLEYVRANRKEMIEEVLGMIEKSNLARKINHYDTRFNRWEKLLKNTMNDNGYDLFLSNVNEMHEAIDQDLGCILNLVIKNPDYFPAPKSAKEVLEVMERKKSNYEQVNLSPQKIGKLLSAKSGRTINFMAYDNLRYEFYIAKNNNSLLGGDNHTYLFKFNPLKSVVPVALDKESYINNEILDEKVFLPTQFLDSKSTHATTSLF